MCAGDGIDNRVVSYGRTWPLDQLEARLGLAWLICVGLQPAGTHTGTPCTHMCMLGNAQDAPETEALNKLSLDIAEHQRACGLLASNENPVGSNLRKRPDWENALGALDQPVEPWQYFQSTG